MVLKAWNLSTVVGTTLEDVVINIVPSFGASSKHKIYIHVLTFLLTELVLPGGLRSGVDPSLTTTSRQVLKYVGYFLDIASTQFNWIPFIASVTMYGASHSDLRVDKLDLKSIHQGEASVSEMVNKIMSYISDTFKVKDGIDKQELTASVQYTFTNLKTSTEHGFADFSSSSTSSNSSYPYRVAFSFLTSRTRTSFIVWWQPSRLQQISSIKHRGGVCPVAPERISRRVF